MIKVLSFGELLWDIIGGKAYIGGAPFNLKIQSGAVPEYPSELKRNNKKNKK